MSNKILFAFVFLCSTVSAFSQTYITNVTVADVEKQKLVPDQTVIVINESISKIQSAKINIPANATVIDGTV